jgi:hypothetical protein
MKLLSTCGIALESPARNILAGCAAFSCTVENLSLTTAEDVKIGAVLWSLVPGPKEEVNSLPGLP